MSTKIQCSDNNHDNNMGSQKNTGESITGNKKIIITNLSVYNNPIWCKKLIIKELNIESTCEAQQNIINGSNDDFNNLVPIKIVHRSKELEEKKSKNLDKLNALVDKDIKFNKLTMLLQKIFFSFYQY